MSGPIMIIKIALRNLLRHRRRTLLSAATIAAGLLVFIFMNSLITGLDRGLVDNMVNLSTGAVKIQTARYDREKKSYPLDFGLADWTALAEELRRDSRVADVTPRTPF